VLFHFPSSSISPFLPSYLSSFSPFRLSPSVSVKRIPSFVPSADVFPIDQSSGLPGRPAAARWQS
jgi:hypothetical protein